MNGRTRRPEKLLLIHSRLPIQCGKNPNERRFFSFFFALNKDLDLQNLPRHDSTKTGKLNREKSSYFSQREYDLSTNVTLTVHRKTKGHIEHKIMIILPSLVERY